ncbi:MAG: hypothetical protein KJ674_03065 [Nanoarchaeota archaeon]|nr:hypothetical protein [Nanoarchaeota archaeon]
MNKKGKMWSTLVSIILIAVVVVLILPFLGTSFSSLTKNALGLTENDFVNYTQKNDEGKLAFEGLTEDIEECKNNGKKDCVCDISLGEFYGTHKLEFNSSVGKLINMKEGNEITMAKGDILGMNCLFKDNQFGIKEKVKLEIFFNKEEPYILNKGFLRGNHYFTYSFVLYNKDNKICWLTNEVSKSEVDKLNYC